MANRCASSSVGYEQHRAEETWWSLCSDGVSPLRYVIRVADGVAKAQDIKEVHLAQVAHLENASTELDERHKEVAACSTEKQKKSVASQNRRTGIRPINFAVRGFVLREVMDLERGKKPSLHSRGPFRVSDCRSEYIFAIEDLLSGEKEESRGRRLKLCRNSDFEVTEELKEHLAYQDGELLVVERFEDTRRNAGTVELQVKWRSFTKTLREDFPVMLQEYLDYVGSSGTARNRRIVASIHPILFLFRGHCPWALMHVGANFLLCATVQAIKPSSTTSIPGTGNQARQAYMTAARSLGPQVGSGQCATVSGAKITVQPIFTRVESRRRWS